MEKDAEERRSNRVVIDSYLWHLIYRRDDSALLSINCVESTHNWLLIKVCYKILGIGTEFKCSVLVGLVNLTQLKAVREAGILIEKTSP